MHISCHSNINPLSLRNISDNLVSVTHHSIQGSVHDLLLSSSTKIRLIITRDIQIFSSRPFDHGKKCVIRLLIPFPRHKTQLSVLQILQPFEIRNSHSTCIGQHVWDDANSPSYQVCMGLGCDRTIRAFNDYFAIEILAVVPMNTLLHCAWSEDVAFIVNGLVVRVFSGAWEAVYRACLCDVIKETVDVNSVWVVDRPIVLINSDNFSTSIMAEFSEVGADITKSLDNDGFSFHTFAEAMFLEIVWVVQNLSS